MGRLSSCNQTDEQGVVAGDNAALVRDGLAQVFGNADHAHQRDAVEVAKVAIDASREPAVNLFYRQPGRIWAERAYDEAPGRTEAGHERL